MYRSSPVAPRIVELQALIESEAQLREDRKRHVYEQDELVRSVDDLETQVAEAERGGLFKKMFGKKADRAALQAQLDEATAKRDASIANERAAAARLGAIAAARTELAELETGHVAQLLQQEGPLGDALRAHAAAIAEESTMIAKLAEALDKVGLAYDAMVSIHEALDTLQRAKDLRTSNIVMLNVSRSLLAQQDIDNTRERIATSINYARQMLVGMAYAVEQLAAVWPPVTHMISTPMLRDIVTAVIVQPAEDSRLAAESPLLSRAVEATLSGLLTERRTREARRDEHDAQSRALAAEDLRGR